MFVLLKTFDLQYFRLNDPKFLKHFPFHNEFSYKMNSPAEFTLNLDDFLLFRYNRVARQDKRERVKTKP